MVRVAEDRDVRIGVRDLLGVDARDVHDHEVGGLGVLDRDQAVLGQKRLELAPEKEVDPTSRIVATP